MKRSIITPVIVGLMGLATFLSGVTIGAKVSRRSGSVLLGGRLAAYDQGAVDAVRAVNAMLNGGPPPETSMEYFRSNFVNRVDK